MLHIGKSVSLKTLLIILIAVIVIGGGAAAFYFSKQDSASADGTSSTMVLDENALEGGAGGKSLDEMMAEMQEKVDETSIVVDYAFDMIFPDGSSEGEVKLGNPLENIYPMQFMLSVEETGEVVYKSDLIPIGSHIEKIKLSKDLDKGVYPAILTYQAYDEELKDFASSVSVAVSITVQS